MFPKRVEYIYYPSHPNNRLIRQCLFDDNGDLKAILFLFSKSYGVIGLPDIDDYKRTVERDNLQNDLMKTAYKNNAYDVNTASPTVRKAIEHELGLSGTEDISGDERGQTSTSSMYCDQLRADSYQKLKRILWIERIDAKSFNVHYGTEDKQPTVTVKYTFSSNGPYKTKYEHSFDGMVKKESTQDETGTIQNTQEEKDSKIYDLVEQMPSFPGGQRSLLEYLRENVSYPTVAAENGVQGRVVVEFVVSADGTIKDVKVEKGADPSLDKEAVRVVESMPKWLPGKQNGECINVRYRMPVTFNLQ